MGKTRLAKSEDSIQHRKRCFLVCCSKGGILSSILDIMLINNRQLKHLLGPDVILQTPGYGSSECVIGVTYPGEINQFKVLLHDAFIEYLDVSTEEVANKLCAAVSPFRRVALRSTPDSQ